MPFQLDKKKLMIGGGLLLLLIIVIIAVVAMKKKSPQQHAADAQDAANMAVMHGKIAQAAASSPDNSAKDSVVKAAIAGSNQAAAQAVDSGSKAAAGGVLHVPAPTIAAPAPTIAAPTPSTASGKYYLYFIRDGTYLNTTNLQLVSNKANASVVYFNSSSGILSNADRSKLTMEGVQVQASFGKNPAVINVPGGTAYRTALNVNGYDNTFFPVFQSTSVLGVSQSYDIANALFDPSYAFALVQA